MTKRRAVRGDSAGWEGAEGDIVEAAVLVAATAPSASIILVFCSISARLLRHCLRRGNRRAVPDAVLGTETKTSRWFDAGMGPHEADTSPQHSVGAPAKASVSSITSGLAVAWTSREDRARRGDRPRSASGDERILDHARNRIRVHRWMMKSASDAEPYSSRRVLFTKKAGFFNV